ncbi:MAG: putative high-affinity branched-chain amino acid transport protein superfamily, atp bind, partial [Acidimicrobiia bacterium]|nr:putative high-affinity branched-chain amino acid transport protein superfamily, atp bind [Acidimicrobiia bacterium]
MSATTVDFATEGGPSPANTLLECRGLSAGYGQVTVLRDVNIRVDAGEVVALIGPNGAGKSTTLLTLAGEIVPSAGEVHLLGQKTTAPMHVRCRNGLGFVTEERSVIMELTAAENLRLAGVDQRRAVELFPGLATLLRRRAGLLSGGEQQMLTLARALGRDPKVLLADELSLGLAPIIVTRLLQTLREAAKERGVGVLLVEQHVRQALAVADRVYVLQRGKIRLSGTAAEISRQLPEIEAT